MYDLTHNNISLLSLRKRRKGKIKKERLRIVLVKEIKYALVISTCATNEFYFYRDVLKSCRKYYLLYESSVCCFVLGVNGWNQNVIETCSKSQKKGIDESQNNKAVHHRIKE